MRDIKISIEEQSKVFKKHLDEEDNERIIFSAAFGAGKTYFLKEFFRTNEKEYLTINLSPVNYSIATNEDIFKSIKFDILFELLAHHGAEQPGKTKIRPDIFYGLRLYEKADSFFTSTAAFFGALNKDIKDATEVVTTLATLYSQITEFASAKSEIEENPSVSAFLKHMLESYHKEADDVTGFIELILNQLSSAPEPKDNEKKENGRKKVLVIDDLDRLDPEHIFRLFNVFSAHFDYNQSIHNKFGFDKVIFVCDIQNIRNIFRSRYGLDTDFSGYIDKFFSQEIFYFNNEKSIKNYVNILLKSIKIENRNDYFSKYFNTNILYGGSQEGKWLAFYILFELVVSGALKPRRIYSPHKAWVFPEDTLITPAQYQPKEVPINCIPSIVTIQLLSSIIGGGEQLLHAVKYAATQQRSIEYHSFSDSSLINRLISSLLVIDYQNHRFEINDGNYQKRTHKYHHPDGRFIAYTLRQDDATHELYYSTMTENSGVIQLFELLPAMVQKLFDSKIIK